MSSDDGFDPRIDGRLSDDAEFMEDKIEKDMHSEGMMKKLVKRPDFPLFLLGIFILILLLFILVKLPAETIETKKETGFDNKQTEDLKKALNDIRNEIVEIRFALSGDNTESGNEFVTALNSLEKRFDERLGSIEKKISKIHVSSVSSPRVKNKASSSSSVKNKKPISKKKAKKSVKKDNSFYYIVQKGDTLYRIAKKYNISVPKLKSWNNIKNNSISVGQRMLIKN